MHLLFGHFVRVPCVHGESGGSRCKAVSFWSEQFTMAVLAVDIVMVVGAVGAVKSFVTACCKIQNSYCKQQILTQFAVKLNSYCIKQHNFLR